MMKYPKEYIEEIKSRLKVSKVVGSYVKLQKRGKEFVGLSPFSNEKTPSFTVNDDKGFYHCFSTAEHGNIFDFIMKTQNLKFGEAVKKLASEAGLQAYRFTKLDEEKEKKWKIYSSLLEEYKNFCKKELHSGKYKHANEYLKKRKFREEDIRFFDIGYVDIKSNFYECIKQKYNNEQILNSGIFYFDENRKKYVERFKGRIIFPIKNINGTAIAFAGRTIVSSKFAKYINSPETLFYKKGNNLYNINSAKKTTNLKDEILIVEGFMDVISLHKFGIQNVVANQGTALTQNQLELSWRFFKNVIICFDGDKSGYQAAARAAERLFSIIKIDHSIAFLFLPSNLDPDNYIHSNGKEDFNNLIKKKVSIHDFLWEHHYNNTKSNDPSSLASFEKTIKNLCNKIADKSLSKYFLEYFLNKISNLTSNIN